MSGVRVLVGTRKGAFVLTADGKRKQWDVSGPHFAGWEIYHVKGASNKFVYDASPETGKPLTTHQWYDGTQHPWEFKRVWHLEPSLTDPDTVYAGVEDAALVRTTDGRKPCPPPPPPPGHPPPP